MNELPKINRQSVIAAGVLVVMVILVAGATMIPRLAETTTPVELGISQPPLVTIIFDTSGSMQWGGAGDDDYPSLDLPGEPNHLNTWSPGTPLHLPGSLRNDASRALITNDNNAVRSVGPCKVWHPTTSSGGACADYARPGPCAVLNGNGECEYHGYSIPYTDGMSDRLTEMRDSPDFRLANQEETPRHILVKQILAGDMILYDSTGADVGPGPGCWFVPRSRGAGRDEQVCCNNSDCDSSAAQQFNSYLDYQDPVPHYQEVYDEHANNGLLSAMASTTIFSAVMFDGYRYDGIRTGGWQYPMDSIMVGDSPYATTSDDPPLASGYEGGECSGADCYNMGLFRFIGPNNLELSDDEMRSVAAYTQQAILDAGFLFGDPDIELDPSWENEDGEEIPAPVFSYPLGKQPVAQSTPFSGVFHDLHQFYEAGQYHDLSKSDSTHLFDSDPEVGDSYLGCRGRHVVLFTDADEVLEVPGGAGNGLGSENLRPEFGYDTSRYPYLLTEDAIESMIDAVIAQMTPHAPDGVLSPRHMPRVHVLAVAKKEDIVDAQLWNDMVDKMAALAEAGRTCAQYYLPADMIPVGMETREPKVDADGEIEYDDGEVVRVEGTCDPATNPDDVCLVPQNRSGYIYNPPHDEIDEFQCEHPALMLTQNDRRSMLRAFQAIFNEIASASGLSARTRPSITNYLDDEDEAGGQYRIFSGLQIEGSNRYWKGILNRQLLRCNPDVDLTDDDPEVLEVGGIARFHNEFEHLRAPIGTEFEEINRDDVDSDRRRIFTSIPQMLAGQLAFTGENSGPASDFFQHTYQLQEVAGSGEDVFGDYNFAGSGTASEPDTRVAFEYDDMLAVFEAAPFSYGTSSFYQYWNVNPEDTGLDEEGMLKLVIDRYRGRIAEKADRVLGGIFNSNPATVGPPDMDIPIDSYRAFRVEYAQRPAMTYVSSVDGLLHAIYAGERQVQARSVSGGTYSDAREDAHEQREAWAYLPQLLHRELADKWETAHQLMDGSPVVQDIRLCHAAADRNANSRVCPVDDGAVPAVAQWRTVLAQGLGASGPGYFALDVTRSGDEDDVPDPIVLWEFGPEWEQALIENMSGSSWRYSSADSGDYESNLSSSCESELDDNEDMWKLSFMGASVAEPALGTVAMSLNSDVTVQRPIAIFGGGSRANSSAVPSACAGDVTGKAIYVVDLQSGDLIRRFIDHTEGRFSAPITGTPALSSTRPGQASTRAFIGDDNGRLFRIDMSTIDPEDWEVEIFFDPDSPGSSLTAGPDGFGPAAFRPALTTGLNRELVVIYGLGQRGDTGDRDSVQAIIALEEERDISANAIGGSNELWVEEFAKGERLTGEPVVFNSDVFFTTYAEDPAEACLAGDARIWRLTYDEGEGNWNTDDFEGGAFLYETNGKWFGPSEPSLIRGLAITMGPQCNLSDDSLSTVNEPPAQQPQLIAQAGSADVGDGGGGGMGGGTGGSGGDISRIAVDLERPQTRSVPLSWSVIGN